MAPGRNEILALLPSRFETVARWSASLSVSFLPAWGGAEEIRTLCCSGQGALLLSQRPLLVGAGQVIHCDVVVLPQRAEVDHNILHLLVFQRDSNLRRQEKPRWAAWLQMSC